MALLASLPISGVMASIAPAAEHGVASAVDTTQATSFVKTCDLPMMSNGATPR